MPVQCERDGLFEKYFENSFDIVDSNDTFLLIEGVARCVGSVKSPMDANI